uniref:Polycystic kidney disease protein 1-like 2 n=1 Tax=Branchiostoma floridae TaxID=7739 RepID=C3YJE4_BRAFL|eukprot:XP_002603532.1 hypothetical protein BRAFLDRAFT_79068 [Branchiostoma floridae]
MCCSRVHMLLLALLLCVTTVNCFIPLFGISLDPTDNLGEDSWSHGAITRRAVLDAAVDFLRCKHTSHATDQPNKIFQEISECFGSVASAATFYYASFQRYNGVDFFAIEARLPADGLSATEDWCRDYQNLCAGYGLRPTGCGENWAVEDRSDSYYYGPIRCVSKYGSDPYINNVFGCWNLNVPVAEVANMAFSAGATEGRSFGFRKCNPDYCQRGINESQESLYRTDVAFPGDGSGDRIVYTVCAGSAAEVANMAFSAGATEGRSFGFRKCNPDYCQRGINESQESLYRTDTAFDGNGDGDRIVYTVCAGSAGNNECATGNGGCAHACVHTQSSHRCICREGFSLLEDGHGCEDMDACLSNPCDAQAICTDNPAPALDATCTCSPGYTGDGLVSGGCSDVNECEVSPGICGRNAECINLIGTFDCKCFPGFQMGAGGCKAAAPPMDLAVTDTTAEGFKVTWSPSHDPDLDLEGYRVVVSSLDTMTAVNQSTDETSFPVVGLEPETDYVIRGLGNSLESIFAAPDPANPQDDIAVGVLKSITSKLDKLDMSDPSTVQSVGGSSNYFCAAKRFQYYPRCKVWCASELSQFQQNLFTWGRGEYQARSSVMELSLLQNDIPVDFNNLTEDFNITIPGGSGNKPATTTVTFPAPGNQSSSYHLLNLTNTAEGFLVTITPLNTSVVYSVSGRYGGRPDDQNYNVSVETYVLPEQCALVKSLSGDEDTEKIKATVFVSGEDVPMDYYIRVHVSGPVTECDTEKTADEKESDSNDFYAYQIQWARLGCVYWNETQEDWRTDGCVISEQSAISSTICHCNHLTAFGSDFATPPNTLDFGALNFSDLVDNGAVVATIIVALCLYSFTSAVIKIAERVERRKVFTQGSQVTLTFSTAEQLGNVELLQLMHDSSGEGSRASWYVDRAAVQDLTTGKLAYFFCNEWLAADRGDGQVVKTFPVASEQDLRSFGFLFPASLRSSLAEEHLFLSVATMPEGSTFTRSERLGSSLSLLCMSMVSSAMWLTDETKTQVVQGFNLGPFSFTLNGVYTGIMTSITCLPVIMAIVLLFQYSRPNNKGDRRVRDVETGDAPEAPTQQVPVKGLPHWCKYVAWVLVVLSTVGSAVFTVLYSLKWGKDKSEKWLSAYFTTFLVDMILMQPAKILLLTILTTSVGKTQAVKKIFEEKRGPASIEANAVSSNSEREAGFNCDAFRLKRKMERLSMTSLANIKQARMRQRRDRRFGDTLWGIVWFCCFLLLVLSIANEHHNTTEGFHQTQGTANTFLQSVDEVNDHLTFWSWLNETALESFYPETSYNDDKPRWWEKGFTADRQTVLVYPPSLIQGRVKPGLCAVPVTMQHLFDECSPAYDEHAKETGAFEMGWKMVRNTSAMESAAPGWIHLPSGYPSLPIYGVTMQYWGDGFGLHLGKSADEMRSILAELKANRWIDKRTRVIFLEAILYNGNVDLFTSLTVVFEFSETAGVWSRHHVQTFRLRQRPGTMGYIYVLLEIIYVIILLYTLWREAKNARAAGLAYLKGPWNIFEIFNFFLAFNVIALYGFKAMYSSKALVATKEGKDQVQHFRSAANISLVYGWFLAFLAFVNMMKLLRLLRFNPFLAKLTSVFRGMAAEFSSFIFSLFIWLSAFGIYAYIMFGLTVAEYSSISKSFSTLFQMSLGNFYYYQLREAAPILGPIFFFAFICIIFLVLMNISMAIIDSALPDVRNHDMPEEDRYFIQGLWERFTAFFGLWKVPYTDDDFMDSLHDSLIEVEIKVEKLWLKRQSLFNLNMKETDLPAEPEFVPIVKDVPEAAEVELHVRHRVIKVRPASPNNCTDSGSQAIRSVNKAPAVVTSMFPSKEDNPDNPQTNQVRKIKSVLSKGEKSDVMSTRRVHFAQVVLVRHIEERKLEWASVKLSPRDKVALVFGEMLTDDHIQAAQMLLRRQYLALQGLEAPAVGHCEDGFAKITGTGLQIHHNGNQHWVLSSSTDRQVCLYDSLGVVMTPSLQSQLYQSYAEFADQARNVLTVTLPDVQRQGNVFDCGLFAIAWAVDIAEGQDVSKVVFDDRKMRSHLETCFKQGKLTQFPRQTSCRKVGPTKAHQISLVCHCQQEGRLGRMEKCKACRKIFHVNCLPVSPPRDGTWACGDCAV